MRAEFMTRVRQHFDAVATQLLSQLRGDEQATLNLTAEETLFVRFNGNRVRQNTDVQQMNLGVTLQAQGRSVEQACTLSGRRDVDAAALSALLQRCRDEVTVLEVDVNQVPVSNLGSSDEEFHGELLAPQALLQSVLGPAQGCDLAGLYAGGVVIRANRNSVGQSHWFATETFFLDYSLYDGPRAAKGSYAGSRWDAAGWRANLERTRSLLALLQRPTVDVKPGQYRSYLAPKAFAGLMGILGWNGLSAAAWKQGRCPFKKLAEKQAQLSPLLTLGEDFSLGLSPRFNNLGEVSAASLPLIEAGVLSTLLVSSRTAKEYGLRGNAAAEGEAPRSMHVAPGVLAERDILKALDTGLFLSNRLFLSNLHYLNWSDPVSARVTGMTRYACFWVEKGEIAGPIHDLRWDESLFDALGSKLLALTNWSEIDPAVDTYSARALGGMRVPGALIDGFTFTL